MFIHGAARSSARLHVPVQPASLTSLLCALLIYWSGEVGLAKNAVSASDCVGLGTRFDPGNVLLHCLETSLLRAAYTTCTRHLLSARAGGELRLQFGGLLVNSGFFMLRSNEGGRNH